MLLVLCMYWDRTSIFTRLTNFQRAKEVVMNRVKDSYENGVCPDCQRDIKDETNYGDRCYCCGLVFCPNTETDVEKGIYTMVFTCCNCKTEFLREVEKGKSAARHGRICPYCGVKDYDPFNSYSCFGYRKFTAELRGD